MNLFLIALAVVPVAILLRYIYNKDTYKEPAALLRKAFIFGALLAVPASLMEYILQYLNPIYFIDFDSLSQAVIGGVFEGYVVAAFSEELCKFMLFMLLVWKSSHFDEYYDGIVYAVFISLGFACIENILYVLMPGNFGASVATAFVRAAISVPAHFLFAVAMGYYLSLAKFDPANRSRHLSYALLVPILLHGTFDAILMVSDNIESPIEEIAYIVGAVEFVIFIIFDVMMWRKVLRRIRKMQELSQREDFNPSNPFDGFKWSV